MIKYNTPLPWKPGAPCILWDIDNVLADDAWRAPLIDWSLSGSARWARYHAACTKDTPHRPGVDRHFELHHKPGSPQAIFITARPWTVRKETENWLLGNLVHFGAGHLVLMRDPDDERSSPEIKAQYAAELLRTGWDVWLAIDDREDVLRAYEALGIRGERIAAHRLNLHEPPASDPELGPVQGAKPRIAPLPAAERATVERLLQEATETFLSRNAQYGGSYQKFGALLHALLGAQTIASPEAWGRTAILIIAAGKLHRYAAALGAGGHADSARDLIVYAAMLEELTK